MLYNIVCKAKNIKTALPFSDQKKHYTCSKTLNALNFKRLCMGNLEIECPSPITSCNSQASSNVSVSLERLCILMDHQQSYEPSYADSSLYTCSVKPLHLPVNHSV